MRRIGLTLGLLLVMGLLAVGAMAVLADRGGPGHGADHGVAAGLQDDGDNGNGVEALSEDKAGNEVIAQAISDAFGGEVGAASVDASSVMDLHERGIGFGAILKLYAIADAKGVTVDDLLSQIEIAPDGKYVFNFGELIKGLNDDEAAVLEAGPKNLGQLVSAAHKGKPKGGLPKGIE